MSRDTPAGFRELRPDEELIQGKVRVANDKGLVLEGRSGWLNYGGLRPKLARLPEVGDRLELVVGKSRWINRLEIVASDRTGGEHDGGGDEDVALPLGDDGPAPDAGYERTRDFFDGELGPDPDPERGHVPVGDVRVVPVAERPQLAGDDAVWRRLLATATAAAVKAERDGGPPAGDEDGLSRRLRWFREQGAELIYNGSSGWKLAPGPTWPATSSWTAEAQARLGEHRQELLALLRGLPVPPPEAEPF